MMSRTFPDQKGCARAPTTQATADTRRLSQIYRAVCWWKFLHIAWLCLSSIAWRSLLTFSPLCWAGVIDLVPMEMT